MKFTDILALAQALAPFVVVSVESIIGALRGAGAVTDDQADADLVLLVQQVVAAKAEADAAAAGHDPQ